MGLLFVPAIAQEAPPPEPVAPPSTKSIPVEIPKAEEPAPSPAPAQAADQPPTAAPTSDQAPATAPADANAKPADSSGAGLPANPTPTVLEQLLSPDEMLVLPPTPKPDESGALPPNPQEPFRLRLAPVEIKPVLPPLSSGLAGGNTLASSLHVHVKGFRFKGNHAFLDFQLQKVVAPYKNRDLTSTELEEARQAVTLKYVQAGYINSGAILPDQDLKGGIVLFQIVEGRLTRIDLSGNWWYRGWWLKHLLRQSAGRPLNFEKLKTGLQLMRQNPSIRQINAELEPGGTPGESILKAEVKENQPFRLSTEVSNKRPPSVGAEVVEIHAADLNFTGHDDPLSLTYGIIHTNSETPDHWVFSGSENLAGSYTIPISPWRTTLEGHASTSDAAIVSAPFNTLNIKSRSEDFGFTLRQPFYESLNHLFDFSFTAEQRKSNTTLLGTPFDLSPGSIDGKTQIFVLRFTLEYVDRSQQHVLALRSTFNLGIDAFHPTLQDQIAPGGAGQFLQKIPDGRFFSWLGQAQYVQRLFNTDNLAVARVNAQFSADPLVSLEQFSLGGMSSVRGYRENQLLRDNGVFASLELRIPLLRNKAKNPIITIAPFFDYGFGWNTVAFVGATPADDLIADQRQNLASAGVGLLLSPWKYFNAQIYWGYGFNRTLIVKDGQNLQDYGLHFSISAVAF